MNYVHTTTLTNREAIFFEYLQKKMHKENRDYVNTNYGYVKNIAGYKNIPGARYLVKNLAKKMIAMTACMRKMLVQLNAISRKE